MIYSLLSTSVIVILFSSYVTSDECYKCVKREKCEVFGYLNLQQQAAWQQKFPCSTSQGGEYTKIFGFTATAKGDYVCCADTLLAYYGLQQNYNLNNNYVNQNNFDTRNPRINPGINPEINPGYYPNLPRNNWIPENTVNPNDYNNGIHNQNVGNPGYNRYDRNPQVMPPSTRTVTPPQNPFNQNNPYVTSSPFLPSGQESFGNTSPGGECPITSFPPKPETGCCGREASDTDRIAVPEAQSNIPNPYGNPNLSWRTQGLPQIGPQNGRRVARLTDDDIAIEDRIAGGIGTDFEQFPWTVLLMSTFDYGNKRASFNCGGSLISSRYVLTAGHCVFDEEGKIIGVEMFSAEYDKRTFPVDCKIVPGEGQKCINNVVMNAEDVILHPEYDDDQLNNDIALIRLRGDAPYTNYIRPICLPSIDIDTPQFSNIRLAVAGWGRNGPFRTDIKQSTIVNLVPQERCIKYYPGLSRRQICAAGHRGEDTCKGDSGGPLMTVYGGKYKVVGVVSGKRADSPCGTSVPSLYTNVYHYLDWIYSNIKN